MNWIIAGLMLGLIVATGWLRLTLNRRRYRRLVNSRLFDISLI